MIGRLSQEVQEKKGDKPYNVYDIERDDFFDWKTFADTQLIMRKTDTTNKLVQFQKLSWFQFKKENVYQYECNESFEVDGFRLVDCKKLCVSKRPIYCLVILEVIL